MLAYWDTLFSGLVPCRVIAADRDTLTIKVTATRHGHGVGDVIEGLTHRAVVPRAAVFKMRGSPWPRIKTYSWAHILFTGSKL